MLKGGNKMTANYHTHTIRCNHAIGSDREYIKKAIELGFSELGFADHLPQFFPNGFTHHYQMQLEQIPEYFERLFSLKNEYAGKIKIHIGFEAEYFPGITEKTVEYLKTFPLDYLILGQHLIDEYNGPFSSRETDNPDYLKRYVQSTIKAIETNLFSLVAHPDLINYTPEDEIYYCEMKKLCLAAKKHNIPLECNMLGAGNGSFYRRNYPSERFFKIAAEVGNEVIISCDAHDPDSLDNPRAYNFCINMLNDCGITPIEKLKLIKP